MKQKKHCSVIAGLMLLAGLSLATLTTSCSKDDGEERDGEMSVMEPGTGYSSLSDGGKSETGYVDDSSDFPSGESFVGGEGSEPQNGNHDAGIITAAEWNDLIHWDFWAELLQKEEFKDKSDYWKFYTDNRVAVKVTSSDGHPRVGCRVALVRERADGQTTTWEAVTDNHGQAECWVGFFQRESVDANELRIAVEGKLMDGHPQVSSLGQGGEVALNSYVYDNTAECGNSCADIAFIVDATGSMTDEIEFLKSDLTDIISKVAEVRPSLTMRTAALFYRDAGDEYLTRHSDFTDVLSTTTSFIAEQQAEGGGDYPEAVHTALEHMFSDLSWSVDARARLAFLILDAPPHHQNDVISSLQESIAAAARQGIRLIPVTASGIDKNTELLMRFFAIATGGTYVFITNDSGVGNSHIEASVGDHEVELLNSLIIRLIGYYTE